MINFDKKVVCGPEYVALREMPKASEIKVGNLVLSNHSMANEKLAHYVIEDIGFVAAKEFGLKVGDYVLADKSASFYHSSPVALFKYTNVILKTNEDRTEFYPLKNSVFVSEDEYDKSMNGFVINVNTDKIRTGKIIDMNISEDDYNDYPFKVGDHVMLVRTGDFVSMNSKTLQKLWIFKPEMLICKLED